MELISIDLLDEQLIDDKIESISHLLSDKKIIVAFSGGVDSTVLAHIAKKYAKKVVLAMQIGLSVAIGEFEAAEKQANQLNLELLILEYNEFELSEQYTSNPENRCYYCKELLHEFLENLRIKLKYDLVASGTNYSDLSGHRPGYKAVKNAKALSPLVEGKLNKQEIRFIARRAKLLAQDKAASPCLASRFPLGIKITESGLTRVAQAEYFIKNRFHFKILRVRNYQTYGEVIVGSEELIRLRDPEIRKIITNELEILGFPMVKFNETGYKAYIPR